MNRPFYALAALVAALTGSAVGIGPARCPKGVSRVAVDARAYCAMPKHLMPSHANGPHYFVHFEEGASIDSYENESYEYEVNALAEQTSNATTQGSDSNEEINLTNNIKQHACTRYQDSCGRDGLTGQIYMPVLEVASPAMEMVDYWSLFKETNNEITATSENESWPADERIARHVDVYQEECPFLKNEAADTANDSVQNEIDYENLYTENDYVAEPIVLEEDGEAERLAQQELEVEMEKARRSLQAWLASMLPPVQEVAMNEIADESAYFVENEPAAVSITEVAEGDLSATLYEDAAIAPPSWVDNYFEPDAVASNEIENDYATAENEAAYGYDATAEALSQPLANVVNEVSSEADDVAVEANDAANESLSQPAGNETSEAATDEQVPEYGPYGPALPYSPAADYVDYDQEYQSNYELLALDAERENEEIESDDIYRDNDDSEEEEAATSDWEDKEDEDAEESDETDFPVRAIWRAIFTVFGEMAAIMPEWNETATMDELRDASQQTFEQWTEYVAIAQEEADILASTDTLANTSEFEDYFAANDDYASDLMETEVAAEKISAPSNEWHDSVAEGLRATGNLFLNWADELQTTAGGDHTVSVRATGTGSR